MMAEAVGLVAMPTRPSAAWREAFLLAAASPFLRSSWEAFSVKERKNTSQEEK